METLIVSSPDGSETQTDGNFRGLSANTPENLEPGVLTIADNVIWDNGTLRSRPGLRAMLTAPLGHIGSGITFEGYDGNNYALIVAGGADTAGIYLWLEDDSNVTLVSGATLFHRDATQFAICGNYIFISGATDGVLYRYSYRPAFQFESAAGLAKPAYTLTADATNEVNTVLANSANWHFDAPTAYITFPDDHWQSGDAPGTNAYWTVLGGVHDLSNGDPNFSGDNYLRFDEPQSSIRLTTPLAVPVKANAHYTGTALSTRHSIHFLFKMRIKTDRSNESVMVSLIAYDGSNNRIAQTDFVEFTSRFPGFGADGKLDYVSHVFSFANQITDTAIAGIGIQINAGPRNTGGANGPYISWFQIIPVGPDVQLFYDTVGGAPSLLHVMAHDCVDYLGLPSDPITDYMPLGQERLSMALPGATDFSNISQIAIPFYQSVPFTTFPKLGLRTATSDDTPVYTDTLELYPATDGDYLVADLSVLSAAQRTGITHLELLFLQDIPMPAGYSNANAYFQIGNCLSAGRLTPDTTYAYRVREYHDNGTGDALVSPATDRTLTILPSRVKAEGQVVIGAGTLPANASLDGVHPVQIEVYREGGTSTDGLDRLVARFTTGANRTGATWSWNDATRTFTDNTPDLLMIGTEVLEDHDATPTGLTCLAIYAGRLVGSIKDVVHLSQATAGRAVGVYWTTVYDSEATNAASSGQVISVTGEGGFAGGDVVALVNHTTRLIVMMPHAPYVLIGDRPSFSLRRYETDNYYGAISHRSVFVQAKELVYLSADGLRSERFDNFSPPVLLSSDIEQILNPFGLLNGPSLDTTAYALAFVAGQAQRIFLSAPLPGGTDIAVLYVFDRRRNVWTRWLTGYLTDCLRFAEGDRVYFTGADGQVYRLGPEWGDTVTRGGDPQPVPIELQSRTFTVRRMVLRAQRFAIDVQCADDGPAYTFLATGDGDTVARRWSRSFAPGSGRKHIQRLKVTSNVRGAGLSIGLVASTINPVTLHRWQLEASEGALV